LGKFPEAQEGPWLVKISLEKTLVNCTMTSDIRIADILHPGDKLIQAEAAEIKLLIKSHTTAAKVAAYVAKQPKPPPKMTFKEGMALNEGLSLEYTRIPPPMDMRFVSPPTFWRMFGK
jgi:hypothetical protein